MGTKNSHRIDPPVFEKKHIDFWVYSGTKQVCFFKKKTQLRISHSADTLLPALGKSISIINEDVMGK